MLFALDNWNFKYEFDRKQWSRTFALSTNYSPWGIVKAVGNICKSGKKSLIILPEEKENY
jgi:hypothetical protein